MRIVKLEYNDGSVKYRIEIKNFRGGWDPFIHQGQEVLYDNFEDAYEIINPKEKHNPYVIKETTVYEKYIKKL